jgi:hypothetical protein
VRHHAEHISALAADAGDVVERSVRVGFRCDLSLLITVTEDNALLALESGQGLAIAEVVPFHVADRDLEHIAFRTLAGEWRLGGFDAQQHLFADVLETGVTQQCAGQKAALAEDLEAVADAEDETAGLGEALDLLHHGSEFGDGAGAKIVTIGKAARHDDGVTVLKLVRLMPQKCDRLFGKGFDDVVGVVIAVRSGEDKNAEFHDYSLATTPRLKKLCNLVRRFGDWHGVMWH